MKRLLTAIAIPMALTASAQQITSDHDATKMNQITVQETGIGALTPELYYQLTHNVYKRTAALQNKMAFRTSVGVNAYQQVELAEKFDSAMIDRAKIEALNMADRQVDMSWATEQRKIEGKLSDFQRNINRLMTVGANRGQINLWTMEFQKYITAITAVKEAYMPNSQRKKQYMRIYSDIKQSNDNLIKFIVYLNGNQQRKKLLASAHFTKPDNTELISKSALTRWRQVGWRIAPGGNTSGGGGIIIDPNRPTINPWVKPDKPIIPSLPTDSILDLPIDPISPIQPINPSDKFEPSVPIGPEESFDPNAPIQPLSNSTSRTKSAVFNTINNQSKS